MTIQKTYKLGLMLLAVMLFSTCAKKTQMGKGKELKLEVVSIGFYNLENLFDTIDQPNRDEDFLPNGSYRWTGMKYRSKLKRMAYAISQLGIENTPNGVSIFGVAEVENRGVLMDLVKQKEIAKRHYAIVHYDSPDRRGIDVALLYNPRDFVVTHSHTHRLILDDSTFRSRDQLVVSGYLKREKIHIIVNHWPSRYGGEKASAPNRIAAAKLNKHIIDSIQRIDKNAHIITMGDFNDDPDNQSVKDILNAKKTRQEVETQGLYNPFWKILDSGTGSLAYKGSWNLFDQIILTHSLIPQQDNMSKFVFLRAEVFNKNFLIQQEGQYRGTPLRTHGGGVWLDGYSDHLPTLIYLARKKK